MAEFSPVTDFRESTCRQYEENICSRAGLCNFMHLKPISRDLRRRLFGRYKKRKSSRSRSRSRFGFRSPPQPRLTASSRGFGHGATERRVFERGTTPSRSRCTCSSRYELHSCQRNRAEGLGTGRQREGSLNEAQRPHVRGVRVALGTSYTRVRGTGRASRDGGVSSSPARK
jgi:splicing factor U2AF subunit